MRRLLELCTINWFQHTVKQSWVMCDGEGGSRVFSIGLLVVNHLHAMNAMRLNFAQSVISFKDVVVDANMIVQKLWKSSH